LKILSNKNVLVLGASGQLGSELQRHLGSIPSHVTYLRKSLWGKGYKNKRNCKFISLDLLKANNETIKKLIFKADIIIHLAADTSVQVSAQNERNFLISQLNLLNRILLHLIGTKKQFIFSSSCSVYGLKHKKTIIDSDIPDPWTSYDLLKTYSDQMVQYYNKVYKISCCSIRFSNIYGNDSSLVATKNRRILNKFIVQMGLTNEVSVVGNGKFYRNYLHVTDAARMIIYLLKQKRFNQSIYLACSRENIFFMDAVKLLVEMYEIKFNKKIKINKNLDINYITDTRSYKLKPSQLFLKSFKYKFDMKKGFAELLKGEI